MYLCSGFHKLKPLLILYNMTFVRNLTIIISLFVLSGTFANAVIIPGREQADSIMITPHDGIVKWDVSMFGIGATDGVMPFWSIANKRGIFPSKLWNPKGYGSILSGSDEIKQGFSAGGLMTAGADIAYMTRPEIEITAGLSIAGYGTDGGWNGLADRLYFGVGWKKLHLDIGMKDRTSDFNGLSLTGGNIVYSGNARNLPGYNLNTDFIYIPGTRRILALKANFADYGMWDNRFVKHAMLHNQSIYAQIRLQKRVHLTLGLEVWSQWSGNSPLYGKQPSSAKDYLRIILGKNGGNGASVSDQINALGNHLGRELIRLDWRTDKFTFTFQHDIPFDDGSGMGLQNFPDGVNTLNFSFIDKDRWVSDILFEFVSTKSQSGPRHDRPAKPDELEKNPDKKFYVLGGNDNYFNNGEYKSGWTYFGRTIGLPLLTPMPADSETGQVYGVCNNRVLAYHFGLKGKIAKAVPYKFLFTYSRNFGSYGQRLARFDSVPEQFSMALEGEWPGTLCRQGKKSLIPMSVGLGLYADFGNMLHDSFGFTIRVTYSDRKKF